MNDLECFWDNHRTGSTHHITALVVSAVARRLGLTLRNDRLGPMYAKSAAPAAERLERCLVSG